MAYEKKVDELVGRHVSEFQREYCLARQMKGLRGDREVPPMPYGYPLAVYRPVHLFRPSKSPKVRELIARTGGKLSNGVPRVLSMDFMDGYILGVYNPTDCRCD